MTNQKNLRQQFADTMLDVGRRDENLVVLVGDISSGLLKPFAEACEGRFFNIGILEQSMLGIGAGMSKIGLKPVMHTIASFMIERAFEQIKLDFCYQQLGGNIISVGAGFDYSNLGSTHHCYNDFALLKTLPRTQIIYPGSAVEFDQLFRSTYKNDYLTYFRLPAKTHKFKIEASKVELGKGIRMNLGSDLSIVATGPHLDTAMDINRHIGDLGASADVIYLPTISPLDNDIIRESAKKTKKMVVIEEHMTSGGLGDDILRITHDIETIKFYSASIPNQFVTSYGTYEDLRKSVGLTSEQIVEEIKSFF